MKEKQLKIGIILIAAGNSSRLGTMKQLILLKKKTLLQVSSEIAQQLSSYSITILGYNQKKLMDHLRTKNTLSNNNWSIGMGTSIALGVNYFKDSTDGVMIMQCDQYRLAIEDYFTLINTWQNSDKGIVASQYSEFNSDIGSELNRDISSNKITIGAPAIFSKFYYDKLLLLQEKGAKALLEKYKNDLEYIKLADAAFDLDTPDDLKAFKLYQKQL